MDDVKLADLRARLEGISDELADLAHERLRDALQDGDAQAEADERLLERARRSVLKAAALLSGRTGDEDAT